MAKSALITTLLSGVVNGSSVSRFHETSSNLQINGWLFDVRYTPAEGETGFDFLKDVYVSITERIGEGNGGAISFVNSVPLYDLLTYSDLSAGVAMQGVEFEAGKTSRISGFVKLGFVGMSGNDALECTLSLRSKDRIPAGGFEFRISSVFRQVQATEFIVYDSAKPTGADQPYNDCKEIFYIGSEFNTDVSVRDETGTNNVNIEDAVAYTNATGELEFFTRVGQIWGDIYDIGQNITLRVPVNAEDTAATVLLVRRAFAPDLLGKNAVEIGAERAAIIEKCRTQNPTKFEYLKAIGIA